MFKEHERVVLNTAVPAEGLEAGAVVALKAAHVRPVGKHEITHARELVPR